MTLRRSIPAFLLALALLLGACGSQTARPGAAPAPTEVPETEAPEIIPGTEAPDVKGQTAELQFESFDGGGPDFTVVPDDPALVSWEERHAYAKPDHELMTGAGYTVSFTFTGLKPGETRLTVQERSPIAENLDHYYTLTVDAALNVTLRYEGQRDPDAPEPVRPRPMLALRIGDRVLYANPEDNGSARALIEALSETPLTLTLRDYGGFEKVGELPWELPRCDETITTVPGDLILYQGTQLSIYYDENTWSLTRLAKVYGMDRAGLLELLGPEDVEVELWVEWSE